MNKISQPTFSQRLIAAHAAGAIGDAMGAPVEGRSSRHIRTVLADWDWTRVIPPQDWDGHSHFWKGDGRITDDTLMVEALMEAYARSGDHLDAYGWESQLLPVLKQHQVWVPEYQKEMPIFERLWIPEKYPYWRLYGNVDPRTAGVGNLVNCGVAMYSWPVGAINAGDPRAAYQEAAALGSAHNESFAVEAAAVMAAAMAVALDPVGSINQVLNVAGDLARDGTARAIAACVAASDPALGCHELCDALREAIRPFDQRTGVSDEEQPFELQTPNDYGKPSRLASIEELPVALGILRWGGQDYLRVLRAAVTYGRDCDSTAGMAGSLWGALNGPEGLPADLLKDVERGSKRDFAAQAGRFAETCRKVMERDHQRWSARRRSVDFSTR